MQAVPVFRLYDPSLPLLLLLIHPFYVTVPLAHFLRYLKGEVDFHCCAMAKAKLETILCGECRAAFFALYNA